MDEVLFGQPMRVAVQHPLAVPFVPFDRGVKRLGHRWFLDMRHHEVARDQRAMVRVDHVEQMLLGPNKLWREDENNLVSPPSTVGSESRVTGCGMRGTARVREFGAGRGVLRRDGILRGHKNRTLAPQSARPPQRARTLWSLPCSSLKFEYASATRSVVGSDE